MSNWEIVEAGFDPQRLNQQETVFTIGNGYLGTRGAFEEGYPGEHAVTLIQGVYDDVPIVTTELVNSPNWSQMNLFAGNQRFSLLNAQVSAYRRTLDLHDGALTRTLRWEISPGAALAMEIERFASLEDEHLVGVRWRVRSEGYAGCLEFRAGLSSHADTDGVVHWMWNDQGRLDQRSAFLCLHTRATGIELAEAFSLPVTGANPVYQYWDSTGMPELVATLQIAPGEEVSAEKLVAIFTNRDIAQPKPAAVASIQQAGAAGFDGLKAANRRAWANEWQRCDIAIAGDDRADLAVRYNLFQLLIAAPRNDDRVSIPAKSLSGYGYHGHIFWDTEIFILPFLTYTRPEIARNLLLYRYHTLPGARQKAKSLGYEGALYAWESAATGAETTPRWVTGPDGAELVRIWCGDIEHHISADVAYAVHQYWRVTGDDAFMRSYGAEIFLDTARFWGSRVHWDAEKAAYVIEDVIGPDENHEHVDNNVYTNLLARWNLATAFEVLAWLRATDADKAHALEVELDLGTARLEHWKDVIAKIYQGYDPVTRRFEQFEGYFQLKNLNLPDLEPRSKSVQALLGIQAAQQVQIIKQPDVLMLLYLLENEYDLSVRQANWDYYTPRTDLAYGSSLGPSIQAAMAARLGDTQAAYAHFMQAALTDLNDTRGNSVDGFHAATAGGVWQTVVFGFAGIDPHMGKPAGGDALAHAHLPERFTRLRFQLILRGKPRVFDLVREGDTVVDRGDTATDPARGFPILGAIFDLDGVLTDTSELHYQAWKRLANEEGIPFTRQDNEALRGIPRRESLLLLLKGRPVSEAQIATMMERKNRYYLESVESITPAHLLPGAVQLLEELKEKGVQIAIGSASKNAAGVIERLGIGHLIDAISDGYSVEHQKPAPDLFLHAAAQLGIPPEHCVVFEDAAAGIEAALAGGMWAVGIGPHGRVSAADVVIPNLAGMHWNELSQQLKRVNEAESA